MSTKFVSIVKKDFIKKYLELTQFNFMEQNLNKIEQKCSEEDDMFARTNEGDGYMQCQIHIRNSAFCNRMNNIEHIKKILQKFFAETNKPNPNGETRLIDYDKWSADIINYIYEDIINELESNPNEDGSQSPNIQHWIERKQSQLRRKLLEIKDK